MQIEDMSPAAALEVYRDLKAEIAPMLARAKRLEKFIKTEIMATGELIEVECAKTSFRKGYIRSSWDNKQLRGYAVAHPEVLSFVKETNVSPTVVIKLG